jgi:hypothetical protein
MQGSNAKLGVAEFAVGHRHSHDLSCPKRAAVEIDRLDVMAANQIRDYRMVARRDGGTELAMLLSLG